jgi:hypothetical protein
MVRRGDNVRGGVCIEKDVSVLQVLSLWSVLQVLLQAVAALDALADGRDGGVIDGWGSGGHGGWQIAFNKFN